MLRSLAWSRRWLVIASTLPFAACGEKFVGDGDGGGGGSGTSRSPSDRTSDSSTSDLPDDSGPGASCTATRASPCQRDADCCLADPKTPLGSDVCVALDEVSPASCLPVCQSDADCAKGCCLELDGGGLKACTPDDDACGGGTTTTGPAPGCLALEASGCEDNSDCCDFTGKATAGAAVCVAADAPEPVCAAICTREEDCASGCCGALEGVDYGACLPVSNCGGGAVPPGGSCRNEGDACAATNDCCAADGTTATGAGLCLENTPGRLACTTICRGIEDCKNGGCCVELAGTTDYGACVPMSECPMQLELPSGPPVGPQRFVAPVGPQRFVAPSGPRSLAPRVPAAQRERATAERLPSVTGSVRR